MLYKIERSIRAFNHRGHVVNQAKSDMLQMGKGVLRLSQWHHQHGFITIPTPSDNLLAKTTVGDLRDDYCRVFHKSGILVMVKTKMTYNLTYKGP